MKYKPFSELFFFNAIFSLISKVHTSQLLGRLFSPGDISKKLSNHFLLHFPIGIGSYDHHPKYQGVFPQLLENTFFLKGSMKIFIFYATMQVSTLYPRTGCCQRRERTETSNNWCQFVHPFCPPGARRGESDNEGLFFLGFCLQGVNLECGYSFVYQCQFRLVGQHWFLDKNQYTQKNKYF